MMATEADYDRIEVMLAEARAGVESIHRELDDIERKMRSV